MNKWMIVWIMGCIYVWKSEWMNEWMNECGEYVDSWVNEWIKDSMGWKSWFMGEGMNEWKIGFNNWIHEWLNEWMLKWIGSISGWLNEQTNEPQHLLPPPVAPSLRSLRQTLTVRHSGPDRKGYVYRLGVERRSAVPYCEQWVLLCGAGYCDA